MAEESTPGQMVKFTMENGKTVLKMAMVSGKALSATAISANGKIAAPTASESTSGRTATATKANGKTP